MQVEPIRIVLARRDCSMRVVPFLVYCGHENHLTQNFSYNRHHHLSPNSSIFDSKNKTEIIVCFKQTKLINSWICVAIDCCQTTNESTHCIYCSIFLSRTRNAILNFRTIAAIDRRHSNSSNNVLTILHG